MTELPFDHTLRCAGLKPSPRAGGVVATFYGPDFLSARAAVASHFVAICPRCETPHRWRERKPRHCRKCNVHFRYLAAADVGEGFELIASARYITDGTIADLQMTSGRVHRCIWEERGRASAWWPLPGQARKQWIGLYDPVAWRRCWLRPEAEGQLRQVLRDHFLMAIECDHQAQTDRPQCSCSAWRCDPKPSVGAAVDAWIDHVFEQVKKL